MEAGFQTPEAAVFQACSVEPINPQILQSYGAFYGYSRIRLVYISGDGNWAAYRINLYYLSSCIVLLHLPLLAAQPSSAREQDSGYSIQ